MTLARTSSILAIVCAALCAVAQARDSEVDVVVSYTVAPANPLPPGLKAVAVIDSAVRAGEAGGTDRERKWSSMAADMIEGMLVAGSEQSATPVAVADRRNMRAILDEQDLRLTGLVDTETAARVGTLLEVQGLIVSRMIIRVEYEKGKKSTVDWAGVFGGVAQKLQENKQPPPKQQPPQRVKVYRDPRTGRVKRLEKTYRLPPPSQRREPAKTTAIGIAPVFATKEVEEIARHLTVQCTFQLIDVVTGKTVIQYAPPPYRKTDKASPSFLFGTSAGKADLNPVDHFIGELVERATREFVGMIVPVEVEYTCSLTGKGKEGKAAVQALRADEYDTAWQLFADRHRKDPKQHETTFALGVTSELLGKWEDALGYYRLAAGADGVKEDARAIYLDAKRRLTDDIGRILRSDSPQSRPAVVPDPQSQETKEKGHD